MSRLLNKYKIGLFAVLGLLMTLLLPMTTYAQVPIPGPSAEYYVYDGANIIDSQVEDMIIDVNRSFEHMEFQPQVVVATVDSIGDYTIEEFAIDLFEHWQIGNDTYDNGILLLIAENEGEVRIEVGYGMEGALPDSLSGRIIDNNIEYLSTGDYSTAVEGIFADLVTTVNNEYEYNDVELLNDSAPVATTMALDANDGTGSSSSGSSSIIGLLIPAAFVGIAGFMFKSNKKREDEVRAKLEAKYPDKEFSKEDIRSFIKRQNEKKEQEKYRLMATEELTREVGKGNFTKQMVIHRMQEIRRNEERDKRRRNNTASVRRSSSSRPRSGGSSRRPSGGGGRSGGGGASRKF